MTDQTEQLRRHMLATNQPHADLAVAKSRWDTEEVRKDFTIVSFAAPFVVAICKATGKKGTLEFVHSPRFYFDWMED